jgi:hypothetical protein
VGTTPNSLQFEKVFLGCIKPYGYGVFHGLSFLFL